MLMVLRRLTRLLQNIAPCIIPRSDRTCVDKHATRYRVGGQNACTEAWESPALITIK
jgi:hypothetical protein